MLGCVALFLNDKLSPKSRLIILEIFCKRNNRFKTFSRKKRRIHFSYFPHCCVAKKSLRNWRTFELLSTNQNKASCQSKPIRVEQSWRSIWSVKHSNRISVYNNKEGLRILVFLQGFLLRISTDFLENGWRLLHSVSICCFSWCVILNLP